MKTYDDIKVNIKLMNKFYWWWLTNRWPEKAAPRTCLTPACR